MQIKNIKDVVVTRKIIFVRLDLNVPMNNQKVINHQKILDALPTIRYLAKQGAKIILASHLGRPQGSQQNLSMKPIYDAMQTLSDIKIHFVDQVIGDDVPKAIKNAQYGEAVMIENLRFAKEEEDNVPHFSQYLASLANIYVNEAFACSHRFHASITGITHYLPSFIGLDFDREYSIIQHNFKPDKGKTIAIIGGNKLHTKAETIQGLMPMTRYIAIGGGLAAPLLQIKNHHIVNGCSVKDLQVAQNIIDSANTYDCQLVLPQDAQSMDGKIYNLADNHDPTIQMADIGPNTIRDIQTRINDCTMAICNGPLGIYEKGFTEGTYEILKHIGKLTKTKKLTSLAGGGDMVACLQNSRQDKEFTLVSKAGGAFLELMIHKTIPGIEAIKTSQNHFVDY